MMIVIDGPPIAKQRHRALVKNTLYPIFYSAQTKERNDVQKKIRAIIQNDRQFPIQNPIELEIEFHMPIPKSFRPNQKERASQGHTYHVTKPDIDNLVKFYLDCANGLLWKDDKQIFILIANKKYSIEPKTELNILEISNE